MVSPIRATVGTCLTILRKSTAGLQLYLSLIEINEYERLSKYSNCLKINADSLFRFFKRFCQCADKSFTLLMLNKQFLPT